MALSNEEKQIIQFGQANDKSSDEIMVALTKFRTQSQAPTQGVLAETGQDILETFKGVGRQFGVAGERIAEIGETEDLTFVQRARGQLAEVFRGGARAFGEVVIGAGKAVLPQRAEEAISRKVQEVGGRIGETKFVQNLVSRYQGLTPETKREVDIALGFGEGLAEILAVGKVVKPAITAARRGVEGAVVGVTTLAKRATPQAVKSLFKRQTIETERQAVDVVAKSYYKSFVLDNSATSKKLDKLARSQSFGETKVTSRDLLRELADIGVFPTVENKLIKFDEVLDNLIERQTRLARGIDPLLVTVAEKTPLNTFRKQALESLRKSEQFIENRKAAERQLNTFFDDFQANFGESLSASDINKIRVAMNSRSRAFDKEVFTQDTANVIADIARNRLDKLVPSKIVGDSNAQWGRLQNIKETLSVLDNQPINVGFWGGAFGRYLGVIGLSAVGLDVAGPGGLVIAGIAAKLGGDVIAQTLRNKTISLKAKDILIKSIQRDDEILQKLIREAEEANREFLERMLLPERAGFTPSGAVQQPAPELGTTRISPQAPLPPAAQIPEVAPLVTPPPRR